MATRPHAIPAVTAAALLLVALGQHPYGYYTFLRWAVTVAALVVAWAAFTGFQHWAGWLFVGIALLFNPLAPVYLDRATWRPIDIASAAAFMGGCAIVSRPLMAAE